MGLADHVTLDMRQVATQQRISRQMLTGLHRAELHERQELMLDQMVYSLTAYVMAEHLADAERTFDWAWPDGPWQRFKLKHLPTFYKWHLIPRIRMHRESKTVEVRSWATFPESTLRVPGLGAPVYVQDVGVQP